MANRQVYPSSLFPLRGDISAEAGATTVTVTGIQGIPVISPPVEPVGGDTLFYDDYNNDWYYASPWILPVGTVLEWEGYGYNSAGISWLAPDTLAVGNGTQGDVSGAMAMTALILFGSAAYDYEYDTSTYTTIYSGATQNWNLTLPTGPGLPGQVLETDGTGITFWATVSSGGGTVTSFSAGNIGTIITTSVATATTTPALTFALATQAAHTFWGGPTSGAAATPTFRVLDITDIPSLSSLYLPLLGGTMTGVLTLEASAAGLKDATGSAGSNGNVLAINASGYPVWAAPATSGTVTSVGFTGGLISVATATTTPALTVAGTSGGIVYFSSASTWASSAVLPAGDFVLGGGAGAAPTATFSIVPIANGGTGAATTSQNFVFAGPTSGSGAPSFRALVSGDIPALAYVTSVALGAPTGFTITGSPVTSSGTLAFVMPTGWATGALLLGSGAASVSSLGIGSTGNVLTVSGGTAVWAAPAATTYLGWFYYI